MTSENYSTAGFGSLFLPPSIKRVEPSVGKAKPIYEEDRQYGDDGLLRREAVETWAWEEKAMREGDKDAWNVIPVKIDGLERRYSLDVDYGGAMLDVERDEDSWMNAVVITGLSADEKEALDSSEENYETEELDMENVEPYLEEHSENLEEAFENGEVQIYIGDHKETDRFRNRTYHGRIRTGMDFIGEIYGEELGEQMWQDFKETTVENSIPGAHREESTKWENTVAENDNARRNLDRLM